ncbi:YuaE [Bacillus licheniformis]|nr:YuaE [Bacillus licheniformis]
MSIFNEARKELWSEIQGLSDEMLNKRPAEDEWSIQEVIDHLKKSI